SQFLDYPVRQALRYCPPLVLFIDLNAVSGDLAREAVARSLVAFQQEWAGRGHRCTVGYRSTREDHPALQLLLRSGVFTAYALAPVDAEGAIPYLRRVREFEGEVYHRFGQKSPTRDVEAECRRLWELVGRHVRGGESVISTPLLMHFVSLLDG